MNIHGIRTHPPGLYISLSVPDVLPLSHVLLYNIYKFAVPTSIPLRFISVMGFALYVRRNLCVSVQAHISLSVPDVLPLSHVLLLYKTLSQVYCLLHWQPPALPCRLQQSTIGRLSLNRRVRDGNGCLP